MERRSEQSIRQELAEVEHYLAELTQRVDRTAGYRDSLQAELLDLEGADSQRIVAVR